MLVDLQSKNVTGKEAEKLLDAVNITCNKNSIPNDPASPFVTSGIRLGTAAATTRGFVEEDFVLIAKLFKLVATEFEEKADYIREEVTKLCDKYPLY